MRFACICYGALGLLAGIRAFTTPNSRTRTKASVEFGQRVSNLGWDNDSYLDSLSKSKDDQNQANDAYYGMSRYGRPEGQQGFPSSKQLEMEAQDGFSRQQHYNQQPPPGQPPYMQQPPGALPAQYGPQYGHPQQPMQPPQQPQSFYGQPYVQQPIPPGFPQQQLDQSVAQDAFSLQLALQQQLQQQKYAQSFNQQPSAQALGSLPQFAQQPIPSPTSTKLELKDALPTNDIEGAVLTEEMKNKAKASHTPAEEASQGGQQFRGMMARAKQRAAQQQTAVQPQLPPQQLLQQQPLQIPPNAMDLSIEEQARLFRELMSQRQQQQLQQQQVGLSMPPGDLYQQQQPMWNPYAEQQPATNTYAQQQLPSYPYSNQSPNPLFLPPGVGYDGRRIGRNKDADIISTSADVYLARLKADSTSRRLARDAGDDEKANALFHDPKIWEINGPPINPYREKQQEGVETVPEEMLLFQEYGEKEPDGISRSYSGVNFKQKLAQKKVERGDKNPPLQGS